MQDTLYSLIRSQYYALYDYFKDYIQDKVEIKAANDVINTFEDGQVISHQKKDEYWCPKKDDHVPLFKVDLKKM